MELILTEAKSKVAEYVQYADGVDSLDLSLMVVQDEIGDLVYTKGDLSFFLRSAPNLNQPIGPQLGPKVNDEYEQRQWGAPQEREIYVR
jgi:hypothetical protein